MTDATTGYLTKVHVSADAGATWTKLNELRGVTPPNESVDEPEATHLESPDNTKEFVQGMIDPGDMSMTMNHIEGSATDEYIAVWRGLRQTRLVRITFPNLRTRTFPAFVKGYVPDEIQAGEVQTATLTLRVAGAIARA